MDPHFTRAYPMCHFLMPVLGNGCKLLNMFNIFLLTYYLYTLYDSLMAADNLESCCK